MSAVLSFLSDVLGDYQELPEKLQRRVKELTEQLKEDPLLGKPLEYHANTGDLRDCRKLYFALTTNESPTHRIVYRLLPSADKPDIVELVAIGERQEEEVYQVAVLRLGRN